MHVIKLKSSSNFRDLGGIKTQDGHVIKKKMLIRGKKIYKMDDSDINLLKNEYNLKSIIDLRTMREANEKPDMIIEGTKYYHLPILNDAVAGLSHEKKVHSIKSLVMMPKMEDSYSLMVKDECLENLIKALNTILHFKDDDFAILFHCNSGKDRTGLISALLLDFLGVDRETVIKEYMFTNNFTKRKARYTYLGLMILRLNHKFAKKIMQYYICKENYIKSSIDILEKKFGSLNNFYREKLNISDEEKEKIKLKFFEKSVIAITT